MRVLPNNWMVIAATFVVWLLSFLFKMADGNEGYCVGTAVIAALPLIATVCMYGLAIRTAAARERSRVIVHLTYLSILGLLAPLMWRCMQTSLPPPEAPIGAMVDVACPLGALTYGAVIFWFFRCVEITARKIRRRGDGP